MIVVNTVEFTKKEHDALFMDGKSVDYAKRTDVLDSIQRVRAAWSQEIIWKDGQLIIRFDCFSKDVSEIRKQVAKILKDLIAKN